MTDQRTHITRLHKSSRGVIHAVEVLGLWFDVEYDPTFPDRGLVEFQPRRVIKLQEWDSEVFLHELLHIALAVGPRPEGKAAWWRPDFNGRSRVSLEEQEAFIQHLSHILDDCGYCLPTSTLDEISEANRRRCKRWHPGFPDDDAWSGADWSNAMCGEAGEAANVVKKLRRLEAGYSDYKGDNDRDELLEKLADELADVFLYADLLAAKYGIDWPAAIAEKFNRVSEAQGFPDRIGATL